MSRGGSVDGVQRGCVHISLATKHLVTGGQRLREDDAGKVLCGAEDFAWFGHSIAVVPAVAGSRSPLLVVGAPEHRRMAEGPTVGAVYGQLPV